MTYRDAPELERDTCREHGLTYDPRVQTGCVLCRKTEDEAEPSETSNAPVSGRMVLLVFASVVAIGFACVLGLNAYYRGKRAQVGAVCTTQYGCIDGADCRLLVGTLRAGEEGVCRRRCSGVAECTQGQDCLNGNCLPVAAIGERCGTQVLCPANADCVDSNDGYSVCREPCQGTCEQGFQCLPRVPAVLGAYTTRHCLPDE
jgi:hypothetical protein